jgi:hypothetical protein
MARESIVDVATEPPRIVFEESPACHEPERVDALLRGTLAAARAPGAGWRVTMRVEAPPRSHGLRAEGGIADGHGTLIARRTLADAAGDCAGLARAVGLWASLVLDEQVARKTAPAPGGDRPSEAGDAHDRVGSAAPNATGNAATGTAAPASAVAASGPSGAAAGAPAESAEAEQAPVMADGGVADEASAAAGARNDEPPPDTAPRREGREPKGALEFGVGTFVMTGTGANAILGATPYALIEAIPGFFVRPALVIGESITPQGELDNANPLLIAIRLDGCTRYPGNYSANRGLELTMCGGADVGGTYFPSAPNVPNGTGVPQESTILPQVSLGPSLDLRGEVGSHWSIVLRGVAGLNVIRNGFVDRTGNRVEPEWVSGRLELALAWRVR